MDTQSKNTKIAYYIYFLIAGLFVLIRALSSFGFLDFLGDYGSYVFSFVVQVVILFGGSVFLFAKLTKQKPRKVLKDYGVSRPSKRTIIIAIIVGIIVFFLNVFVSSFFNFIISSFGYTGGRSVKVVEGYPVWLLFVNLIFTALLPAVCEEVAHRGMLLKASGKFGFIRAILISSLLFGLLHLNIEQVFYATLIGIYLSFVTSITGSIIPAMIIHFMNNALSVFLTYSSIKGLAFGSIFTRISLILSNSLLLGIIFIIALVALLIFALLYMTKYLLISGAKDKIDENKEVLDKFVKRHVFFHDTNSASLNNIEGQQVQIIFGRVKREKMDAISKVLFCMTALMLLTLTIFTFVWGVL